MNSIKCIENVWLSQPGIFIKCVMTHEQILNRIIAGLSTCNILGHLITRNNMK